MQIVIDIDDEIYDYITKEYTCMRVKDGHAVAVAIANGTPLPEDATNGDIFIHMFHPYRIKENDTSMWIWYTKDDYEKANVNYTMGTDWWNTPYKRGEKDGKDKDSN